MDANEILPYDENNSFHYFPTQPDHEQFDRKYLDALSTFKQQCSISNTIFNTFNTFNTERKIWPTMFCRELNSSSNPDSYNMSTLPEYIVDNYKFKTNLIPGKTYVITVDQIKSPFYRYFFRDTPHNTVDFYTLQTLYERLKDYTKFLNKYANGGNMVLLADFVEPFRGDCTDYQYDYDDEYHSLDNIRLVFKNVRHYTGTSGITGFIRKELLPSEYYPNNRYNFFSVEPYSDTEMHNTQTMNAMEIINILENEPHLDRQISLRNHLINDLRNELRKDIGFNTMHPDNLYLFDLNTVNIYEDIDNSLATRKVRALTINRSFKNRATGDLIPYIQDFLGSERISNFRREHDPNAPLPRRAHHNTGGKKNKKTVKKRSRRYTKKR